jgi:hypothetical protein
MFAGTRFAGTVGGHPMIKLPELPPKLEEQRVVIGDDAMRMVAALYYVNIAFYLASSTLAEDKRFDEAQRRKMEQKVRLTERFYLKAKRKLAQFYIPPSAQKVIDKYCSVALPD